MRPLQNARVLAKIPYVDIRGYTPLELLFLYRGRAQFLVKAALSSFGPAAYKVGVAALPALDRLSRRWLAKSRNPYLREIDLIAESLGIPGAYFLNLCFEWGCTSGVWNGDNGALLRRVLDWPFPMLGETVIVAHQSGPAGEFYNPTWPGMSGTLHGMAPGRFAAALNQAPMRRHGAGLVGDWTFERLAVGASRALPPSHLLRQVFETARDYASAKAMLCEIPLAVPAIFVLSGVEQDDGCVIERTEHAAAIRGIAFGRVCATNHFESPLNGLGRGWRARPVDSFGRLTQAQALRFDRDGFSWFTPPIANLNSRLAMTANAATKSLSVLGTAGAEPVTEVFNLSS